MKGKVFTSMTQPGARSLWFQDRTELPYNSLLGIPTSMPIAKGAGALGIEHFDHMKVYVGRGLGGGSLVNGAMAFTPRRSFFEQVLPGVDAEEMYRTYFPRANAALGVAPPPESMLDSHHHHRHDRGHRPDPDGRRSLRTHAADDRLRRHRDLDAARHL